jgi:hypothetical protein
MDKLLDEIDELVKELEHEKYCEDARNMMLYACTMSMMKIKK